MVGYGDEEISRHLHPQLTIIILPHRPVTALECRLVSWASGQSRPPLPEAAIHLAFTDLP